MNRTQPSNFQRFGIVVMMCVNNRFSTQLAWLLYQETFLDSPLNSVVQVVVLALPLSVVGSSTGEVCRLPELPFGILSVVVDALQTIVLDIFACAVLALTQMPVCHPWVLVELRDVLLLSALEASFHLLPQNAIWSSGTPAPFATSVILIVVQVPSSRLAMR